MTFVLKNKKFLQPIFWGLILLGFIFINKHIKLAIIQSNSMSPTIKKGEYVIYINRTSNIKKGDILLFKQPGNKRILIKRCWSVPKDSIFYYHKKFYNQLGHRFKKNAVKIIIPYKGMLIRHEDFNKYNELIKKEHLDFKHPIQFNENYYYLRGDNILNSIDSRIFGLVKESDVIGKVLFKL